MRANSVFILVIVLGVLDTHNFSTAFDNNQDCQVNNHQWPLECKDLMIQDYDDTYRDYFLNFSIPSGIILPGKMNVTRCPTDSCTCHCSCSSSDSKSILQKIERQSDRGAEKYGQSQHGSGCFQFVAYDLDRVWWKSCCAYFPDIDDISTWIPEDTVPPSPPKPPHRDAENALRVPLISFLAAIFIMVCGIIATVLYNWYRVTSVRHTGLQLEAPKECSVPVSKSHKPATKILLVNMYHSQEFKHEVKLLRVNLEEHLKCTVVDVNDRQGDILDSGSIERFMNENDFHKVLVMFPRASSSFQPLENFYTSYLCHQYPHENVLAVSLERFPLDKDDLREVPRVYTIPTQLKNLVQELDSSLP